MEREVCQEVAMQGFKEECREVPRQVPRISCQKNYKKIELKELCVNVDIQLPREECTTSVRQECKYVRHMSHMYLLSAFEPPSSSYIPRCINVC